MDGVTGSKNETPGAPKKTRKAQGPQKPARARKPVTRRVRFAGAKSAGVMVRFVRPAGYTDLYHTLLTISWPGFFFLALGAFLAINCVFALLYSFDPDGVTAMRPDVAWNAFFFSVQTFGTVGYGVMAPRDHYANLVAAAESFIGLGAVAVSTGLIFARVSRPTARVVFTDKAVITEHEGVPTLMFRCANRRSNRIMEAEVTLSLAHQVVTREGVTLRRLEDLKVIRARSPLFVLTWMVMHPIDEASPLFGATPQSLEAERAEVVVVLAGEDETFAQRIHARHAYEAKDIVWNHRFADIVGEDETGERLIDFTRFHTLEKAPAPSELK